MQNKLSIKYRYNGEVRKSAMLADQISFDHMASAARILFTIDMAVKLQWIDDVGDTICCSTDAEVQDAIGEMSSMNKSSLMFEVVVPRKPWKEIVQGILADRSRKQKVKVRPSVDRSKPASGINYNELGNYFKFVNREEEVKQLISLYASMDDLRQKQLSWEGGKRSIKFPIAVSISGIGKSTFLRLGVEKFMNTPELQGGICSEEFRTSLDKYLNLRLDCSQLAFVTGADGSACAAFSLVYESFKYDLCSHSTSDEFMRQIDFVNEMTKRGIRSCIEQFTIGHALDIIMEHYPAGILVNIDEADKLGSRDLMTVLNAFGQWMLAGHRILFSVSGVHNKSMMDAFPKAGMREQLIVLPPLSPIHTTEILKDLFGRDVSSIVRNPFTGHLLWLVGGIPRYLQFLITEATFLGNCRDNGGIINFTNLFRYFSDLGEQSARELLFRLKRCCLVDAEEIRRVSRHALSNVVSLCIAQLAVDMDTSLNPGAGTPYTIEDAMFDQIMYLDKDRYVQIPPIWLHRLQAESAPCVDVGAPISMILGQLDMTLNSRDSLTLFIAVLLHRIRARQLLQIAQCRLSELLNIVLEPQHDVQLSLSTMGDLRYSVAPQNIQPKNIADCMQKLPSGTAVINKPTANCADAFVRVGCALIYVQEKLSVVAGAQVAEKDDTSAVPLRLTNQSICEEASKILTPNQQQFGVAEAPASGKDMHIVLFITEGKERVDDTVPIPRNCYVVTNGDHAQLLGKLVSELRLHSVSPNYTDTSVGVKRKRKQREVV
jgi:hypothetical protein